MTYRVFIPTAGLGSRLEGLSKNINKSLVSIAHKPAISYIIEKFHPSIEFVIALGYKADTVREYLSLAYPDRIFHFRTIDKYQGEGSGLGFTLLQCQDLLQCPFIFCSNDTIVLDDINPPNYNWMGFYDAPDNSQYRSIRINEDRVTEICAKGATGDVRTYIGLAGIHNFSDFWQAMSTGLNQGVIEIGESFGLRFLITHGVKAVEFKWFDTGNLDALAKTRKYFSNLIEANILEKEDEAIWFVNDHVIKFSTDKSFIIDRVKRAKTLKGYVPKIISATDNMYVYKKVEGEVLSKRPTLYTFQMFLEWMSTFWENKSLDLLQSTEFKKQCMHFYKNKTYERVEMYFKRFEQVDVEEIINGKQVATIFEYLERVDWEWLSEGRPTQFHGDLHFENILINQAGNPQFSLIDWRQNFAGNMEFGDIYYDFAKLNHGLIMCHELVDKNLFNVTRQHNEVNYDFLRKQSLVDCEGYFALWLEQRGYDYRKVCMLTALIYLNIAALHHYPYSLLLFYLGKSMLSELLDEC